MVMLRLSNFGVSVACLFEKSPSSVGKRTGTKARQSKLFPPCGLTSTSMLPRLDFLPCLPIVVPCLNFNFGQTSGVQTTQAYVNTGIFYWVQLNDCCVRDKEPYTRVLWLLLNRYQQTVRFRLLSQPDRVVFCSFFTQTSSILQEVSMLVFVFIF